MERTLKSSKSRGGCQRCKAKRVKCDETRPACQICIANKVECPGFERPLKWISKHEPQWHTIPKRSLHQQTTAVKRLARSRLSPQTTTPTHGTADESHAIIHAGTSPTSPDESGRSSTEVAIESQAEDWNVENSTVGSTNFSQDSDADIALATPWQALWNYDAGPYFGGGFDYVFAISEIGMPRADAVSNFDTSPDSAEQSSNTLTGSNGNTPADDSQDNEDTRTGSRRYLETFYRISVPGRVSGLADEDFVNHYFTNVCALYSCFDSELNLFRSLVDKLWTHSPTIFLSIQSMAVGHLSNYYPHLAPLGLQKRSQAWKYLQRDLRVQRVGKKASETVLLSLLLLGLSSSWHQSSNTGMQYLFVARNLLLEHIQDSRTGARDDGLDHVSFFETALMYWEMVASFIDPVPITPLPGRLTLPKPLSQNKETPLMPHPWGGLMTEVHYALAEIGRLLRRRQTHPPLSSSVRNRQSTDSDEQWAAHLVEFLHSIELPEIDNVGDYEDAKTAKNDLILAVDAYRFMGLLELYGMFPDMIYKAVEDGTILSDLDFGSLVNTLYEVPSHSWLAATASHILSIVCHIPISSSACRMLPAILLSASGHLRYPDSASTSSDEHQIIVDARYFVEARILVLSRKYPQRPLLQMMDIVKEVWQRLDGGGTSAHWIEVAHEKGWQTLIG